LNDNEDGKGKIIHNNKEEKNNIDKEDEKDGKGYDKLTPKYKNFIQYLFSLIKAKKDGKEIEEGNNKEKNLTEEGKSKKISKISENCENIEKGKILKIIKQIKILKNLEIQHI